MGKVLCLANSHKDRGRCIAGIDLDTTRLVRPVSKTESQAIPEEWSVVRGRQVQPLDILSIPFTGENACVEYQAENRLCREGWDLVGKATPEEACKYCESSRTILHTPGADPIPERYFRLKRLPKKDWKSLQLIFVSNVEFSEAESEKLHIRFAAQNREKYDLRITDDRFTERLSQSNAPEKDAGFLLLLSLTRPWKHYRAPRSKPFKCYKLVAGIIEI